MRKLCVMFLAVLGSLSVPGIAGADSHMLDVAISRAPVAPDGTTAGAQTDFVLTFRDRDPSIDGIAMEEGGTFVVDLPPGFMQVGNGNNVAVLQGWPQSPRVPFPYTISISGNTVTLTMTNDWPVGDFGPGPKQVHLILLDFMNPPVGTYEVSLEIDPDGPTGTDQAMMGVGSLKIIPRTRPSVNAVSIFSGPPGPPPPFFNPLYQTVEKGQTTRQTGLYLWGQDSEALVGVDLLMTNRMRGQLLAEDGRTLGRVRVYAPHGARNFDVVTDGPSAEMSAFVTGVPVGVLLVSLETDPNVAGSYAIEISMNNGNTETLFVEAMNGQ